MDEILTKDDAQNDTGAATEGEISTEVPAETPETPAPAPETPVSFVDSLPEDLRADLKDFKDPEALARAYVETRGKIPQVPEEYALPTLPEGVETLDQAQWTEATRLAKEIGLTQDQLHRLTAFDLNRTQVYNQFRLEEVKKGVDTLKTEWGPQFEANVKLVRAGVAEFDKAYPGLKDLLTSDPVLANHPVLARFFKDLGGRVAEGSLGRSSGEAAKDVVTAKSFYPKSNMNP